MTVFLCWAACPCSHRGLRPGRRYRVDHHRVGLCRWGWASLRRSRRGRGTRDCGKLILNFKTHNLSNIISINNSCSSNNNRISSKNSYSNRRSWWLRP